jgi:GDP-4-dehydro-6-deoxy-D-mannose reductase
VRRVLITGGTGFVGTHLIQYLRPFVSHIYVMASDRSASRHEVGLEFYELDISRQDDLRAAVREIKPTEIYHLAGVSAVDLSWANPALTFEVNVVGTYNLLEASTYLTPPARILNISTAQVYARSDRPLTEESPVRPENPYAASKAMAEMLEICFRKATGGVITARSFNHTGPGQSPTFVLPSFAKQFAEIECGVRPPTLMVGNVEVRRDFSDVRDVVRAYAALVDKGRIGEIYNVCSGIGVALSDVIKQFQAVCRRAVSIEVDQVRIRSGESLAVVGDSSKIRKETGWYPQIPMERTLQDLMDYWREKTSSGL